MRRASHTHPASSPRVSSRLLLPPLTSAPHAAPDSSIKYLVEEEDLSHFRAGKYHTGDKVIATIEGRERKARVANYDDDYGTYTVRLQDGEEVEELSYDKVRKA